MDLKNSIIVQYCRLCQCHMGTVPIKTDKDFIQKILDITKIQINNDWNIYLPQSICSTCEKNLSDINNFIEMVQKVDRNLQYLARKKYLALNAEILSPNIPNDFEEKNCVLKCTKCPVNFDDETILKNHIKSHLNQLDGEAKYFCCPICSKTYQKLASYSVHKKSHPELNCIDCGVVFDNVLRENHKCQNNKDILTERRKKKLVRKAKPKIKIKTDKLDNTLIDIFECNTCGQQFKNKTTLSNHIKLHMTYICTEKDCSKVLPSAYSLKIHEFNHKGRRPFLCVTCGKGFTTKNSLNCHEKIHSVIKGYNCDLCNLGFSVKSNLRAHVRKYHEGVRFYCSQCTKQFLTKCSLDRHEKLHTGIKEFKCKQCSSAFYTSKELIKHQRYHQGLKQHKCEECFKTFFERHHLIIHSRSHTGERPYTCKFLGCGKSFVDSQKLKRHNQAMHVIK